MNRLLTIDTTTGAKVSPHRAAPALPANPAPRPNRFNPFPELGRWLISLCVLMSSLVLAHLSPVSHGGFHLAAAQESVCESSGPETGAYVIRFCLDDPADGDKLTGDVTVSASVIAESGIAPEVKHVQFFFTPAEREEPTAVFRDYSSPFIFTLPTERWSDQIYRLEMLVRMQDGFESQIIGIVVTTENGVNRVPRSTGRWVPKSVETEGPVVVAAVGDGAGGMPASYEVADLIESWDPQMLLYLGDIYNFGSYTEFINYYDPTFGRLKNVTNPVPGDHEGGRQFQGYLDYWDSSQHYYTATAGYWRLFGLDSTERFAQTSPGTNQFNWLQNQLNMYESTECTIAFMHSPRWGMSSHDDYTYMDDLWRLLVSEGVDILITGHEHNYQRRIPLDADGNPDPNGMTQIVVGSGGHELTTFSAYDPRAASTIQGVYGALKLTLAEGQAEFQYIDTAGNILDSGTIPCTPAPGEVSESEQLPSAPTTGTIVNTNGLGALCLVSPDYNAAVITLLPDGTQVEIRGEQIGDWIPVRCADQDGFVVGGYISPDD